MYNRLEGTPNSGSTLAGCDGHGNLNTHLACGFDNGSSFPFADGENYHYGLGTCPFALVGSSVIFDPDNFTSPIYSELTSAAYDEGARICNNSWAGTEDGVYNLDAQEYDALVRDAQPSGSQYATPGNQELVIVFAAGNDTNAVSPPGTAKNVISVGAAESVQAFGGDDGCGTPDSAADNANAVAFFSAAGPTDDGRHKPDLVAPGTHVSGGAPQAANPSGTGTASACFLADASGVCGGVNSNLFFPSGQQFYTASTGTSHSTPCVSGGCALLRQYFINQFRTPPSPAMTKAYLMNSARYMTGPRAGDSLWSETQGMGEMDLGVAFDGVARDLIDESSNNIFTASGQTRSFTGVVADTAKPFRVTVAWTDAPGNTTGAAYNNMIELTVTVGGNTYKGNVFKGAFSTTGGSADSVDNVQSVFLPAGVSGAYTVTLTAANINSPALPNANNEPNQDFALVIYNAGAAPTLVAGGSTLTAGSCNPASGVINPGETVTVALGIQNAGTASTTNLVATLLSGNGIAFPGAAQTYGALAPGASQNGSFAFTADADCGQFITATLRLQDGTAGMGTVSYNFQLGQMFLLTNFSENFDEGSPPGLPAGWSSSTTARDLTGWGTESGVGDSGANAAYCPDNANVGDAVLVSPAILITNASSQLTFRQRFNLEDTFDGGVLQISIGGGAFADILAAGGSFVTGGYIEAITDQGDVAGQASPLKGQQAWSGTSDGFMTTIVNLPAAAFEKTIQLRWVCGTDFENADLVGTGGWWIDSIVIGQGYYDCCRTVQSAVPTILVPANNFQSPSSSVAVSGTASAGAGLTVLVDGTATTTATADANGIYQTLVPLPLGTNSLAVTENGTNTSTTVTVVVQSATNVLFPQILLQPLSREGFPGGTVTFSSFTAGAAPLRYTWLKNGTIISEATASNLTLANLTANSAADYQLIVANSYGKATSDVAALTLTANPFVAGTFYGLFTETNAQFESSGYLRLTLSSLGKFTGHILNAGGSDSFSGMFDINGYFSGSVSRTGATPLALEMNLGLTNGDQRITGQVSSGSWAASLQADRAIYSASNPCPERGKYTLLFGNTNHGAVSPGGDGYGTISVGIGGLVSLQGLLSDNTGIAGAPAGVSASGQWPLYFPLYGKLGSLVGWIHFSPTPSNSFAGTASWYRTGSSTTFTNSLFVAGSTFTNGTSKTPVLGKTNFSAALSGGDLTTVLANAVTLENSGKLKLAGTGVSGLALSINPSTGVVTGSFKDPATGRTAAIKGVVFQQQTNAGGFFIGTGATGNFSLTQP
ncbi:MAG: S8 family serine peptidase [Limisphaerales bacterium]